MTSAIGHLRFVEDVLKRWAEMAHKDEKVAGREYGAIQERVGEILRIVEGLEKKCQLLTKEGGASCSD